MNLENIFFIDTPVEIQEECYDSIIMELENINLSDSCYIYLKFSPLFNIEGKAVFKGYTFNYDDKKDFNSQEDFLIFIE